MEEKTFKNLLLVKSYLESIGYKVSKSTLYEHAKRRKIKRRKDGLFYVGDVEQYAHDELRQKDEPVKQSAETAQRRRNEAEARKLEAQADHWEMKSKIESGAYVERAAFEIELTKRAIMFKNDLESFARSHAPKICNMVKGNDTLIPALVEYLLDEFATFLDRYSEDREFKVPSQINTNKDDIEDDDDEKNSDILKNNSTDEHH
jgi:hypothetical protein